MIIARAYTVLDTVVVEVTCHHPGDVEKNHLVVREERRGMGLDPKALLTGLAQVAELAAYFDQIPCAV